MRAVQYDHYGPPEVLQIREVPIPQLKLGHVLVKVAATSINGADVTVRSGKLKLFSGRKFPRGAGFDFSGEIVAVSRDVTGYKNGDLVWGCITDLKQTLSATAADVVVAPLKAISMRPQNINDIEAGALPGAAASALGVLRDHIQLKKGERILIRGAAGGVGTAAVQLAKAMGAQVVALTRAAHIDKIRQLGADEAFDYEKVTLAQLGTFDAIMDVTGKGLAPYRRLLKLNGRMRTMALGQPSDILYRLFSIIYGSRRVAMAECPPNNELLYALTQAVLHGEIKAVIDHVYSLADISKAHRALEAGGGFGKQVIDLTL